MTIFKIRGVASTSDVPEGVNLYYTDARVLNSLISNQVTNTMIRQSAALSIVGNASNATANVADILALADHGVMRRSGTAIGFGAINLASANAVTGTLANSNTTATSANTASAIVARDASGNFNTSGISLSNGADTSLTMTYQSQTNSAGGLSVFKRGSTVSATSAVVSGSEMGYHSFYGWNGTNYQRGAFILASPAQNYTSTVAGTQLQFYTTNIGSNVETLRQVMDSRGVLFGNSYTPKAPLHIYGAASGLASPIASTQLYVEDDNEAALTFASANTGTNKIYFQRANSTSVANLGWLEYNHSSAYLTGIVEGTRAFTVKTTATAFGNSTSPFSGTTGRGGASFAAGGIDVTSSGRTVLEVRSTNDLATLLLSPTSATTKDIHINVATDGSLDFYQYSAGGAKFGLDASGVVQTNGMSAFPNVRAWVNFNGTGAVSTNQTIRASANVASVFRNNTGVYTVTFTTAMPDANYVVCGMLQGDSNYSIMLNGTNTGAAVQTAASFQIRTTGASGTNTNFSVVHLLILGN